MATFRPQYSPRAQARLLSPSLMFHMKPNLCPNSLATGLSMRCGTTSPLSARHRPPLAQDRSAPAAAAAPAFE